MLYREVGHKYWLQDRPIPLPWSPHGDLSCTDTNRYWCVICWTLPCWCKGASDDVEDFLQQRYAARVPTDDAGICDDCWATLSRSGELKATDHENCINDEDP